MPTSHDFSHASTNRLKGRVGKVPITKNLPYLAEIYPKIRKVLEQGWTTSDGNYYELCCKVGDERGRNEVKTLLTSNRHITEGNGKNKGRWSVVDEPILWRDEYLVMYRLRFDECMSRIDACEGLKVLCAIKSALRETPDFGVWGGSYCMWWEMTTDTKNKYETAEEFIARHSDVEVRQGGTCPNALAGKGKYADSHSFSRYVKNHHRSYVQDDH